MPFNPETGLFEQDTSTIIDSTPDGDTVKEGFEDRSSPAITQLYQDLNTMFKMGVSGVPDGTTIIQKEGALSVNITKGIDDDRQSTIMSVSENDLVDYIKEIEFERWIRIGEVYSGAYTGIDPRVLKADGTNIDLADYPEVLQKLNDGILAKTTNANTNSGAWSNVAGTVWKKPNFINRYTKHGTNVGYAQASGVPNITGSMSSSSWLYVASASGAFSFTGSSADGAGYGVPGSRGALSFNASRSSPVYGRSSTVDTDNIHQLPLIYMGKYTGA